MWRDLDRPRDLSADERRLLTRLTAVVADPALDRQVDTAQVVAVCRCGCPSVRLHGEGPAVPEERVVALSSTGRPDWFSVGGSGPGTGEPVSVVVHVVRGRLHELEVFAGEGVSVPLNALTGLTDVEVT